MYVLMCMGLCVCEDVCQVLFLSLVLSDSISLSLSACVRVCHHTHTPFLYIVIFLVISTIFPSLSVPSAILSSPQFLSASRVLPLAIPPSIPPSQLLFLTLAPAARSSRSPYSATAADSLRDVTRISNKDGHRKREKIQILLVSSLIC